MTLGGVNVRRTLQLLLAVVLLFGATSVIASQSAEAAYPGGNNWIVFVDNTGTTNDIWVIGADGSDLTQLTTDVLARIRPTRCSRPTAARSHTPSIPERRLGRSTSPTFSTVTPRHRRSARRPRCRQVRSMGRRRGHPMAASRLSAPELESHGHGDCRPDAGGVTLTDSRRASFTTSDGLRLATS